MAVPRISAPLMLRSTISTVSAPATCPFRGSITNPTQLLCTLRGRRYRRLTQHLLSGGPLRPYPSRSFSGWTAPAFVGAFGNYGKQAVSRIALKRSSLPASAKCAWRNGRAGRVQDRRRSDACAIPTTYCEHLLPDPETRRSEPQTRDPQNESPEIGNLAAEDTAYRPQL
jgi:hypothetical protein